MKKEFLSTHRFCTVLQFLFIFLIIYPSLQYAEEITGKSDMENSKIEKGQFITLDNGFRVWTQKIGQGPITILTLHGGPGFTHEYFECMEQFFPKDQFQIIFYDQLGSYYSDKPEDISLWTLDRFIKEVEQVRQALGLENFYLYGQSWGGLLTIEYALQYPQHLKGIIISNMSGSVASYVDHLNYLRTQLPNNIQEKLKFYEDKGDFLHPEYEKIMFEEIYSLHLCRLKPWPEALTRSFQHLNTQIYQIMQGPNEFIITGNLKDWNRWNDLAQIKTSTLVIGGKFDTMNPKDLEKMAKLMPNATLKICENGSHCTLYDDQENYFQAIHHFINKIEKNK